MGTNSRHLIFPTAEPFLFQGNQTGCLLVHGFTGTPREMRLLGDFLRSYEWTVLGIRLAGHATSPKDLNRCTWEDWLCSVEDGICLLKETCTKIFIIGLSMGGMLSMIAAERYDVDGLVAISAPYRLPGEWRVKFIPIIKLFVPMLGKGKSDWHDPANAVGHISYPGWPTASIPELAKVGKYMHESAPRVKVPALLVQSTHDGSVPEEHIHLHYKDLGSQDKSILIVQDSGHVVTLDTDRQIVFENIAQFVIRVSKA